MVNIKQMIVPDNLAKRVTYGGTNKKQYITVHQTGNTSKGADAGAHARLQANGNSRNASWHYQVDDKEIIQSFEDSAQCWHAGDGRGQGNLNSIGIELCINSDGDYKKTLEKGAELVRHLMAKYNIPISNIKQHNHWSGKNCPAQIRAGKEGISWNDF
uniref:peptidoglycan recognition protein family protein n=1 Tax=Gracilibacillus dipsosauri TaxID=178340 RepID=UPI0024095D68